MFFLWYNAVDWSSAVAVELPLGEVAEWSNVPDSKSGVLQGTVGSNPTLSAKRIG